MELPESRNPAISVTTWPQWESLPAAFSLNHVLIQAVRSKFVRSGGYFIRLQFQNNVPASADTQGPITPG